MKKYLFIYAVIATAVIIIGGRGIWSEKERLRQNNEALTQSLSLYRTKADKSAAEVDILQLRCREFERLRAEDAKHLRAMGIKIRRLESSAKSVNKSEIAIKAPTTDTVIVKETIRITDTVKVFCWRDSWVKIDGQIGSDSVYCRVESTDTLHQRVWRVPRKFLFFRYGTKAIRQQIVCSNPHNKVVYTEFIKIDKAGKRR
ncbi:MAG: hypothetical protein IKD41_07695 [Alistipes sp.]|nr:hypothetical protein [Alistipes sp.]